MSPLARDGLAFAPRGAAVRADHVVHRSEAPSEARLPSPRPAPSWVPGRLLAIV